MATWATKDPDAVLDYLFTIPLDEGDEVSAHTFEKVSGDVSVDSESRTGAEVTAWLSGGTDGETAVFRVSWTTSGGREADAVIYLPVSQNSALLSKFRTRYSAFADVTDARVLEWLSEGVGEVAGWPETMQDRAAMLYAAHQLVASGQGRGAIAQGVTSFKSGTFSATLSDGAASRTGFDATVYGRDYLALARRYFGGPRLAWTPPTCST